MGVVRTTARGECGAGVGVTIGRYDGDAGPACAGGRIDAGVGSTTPSAPSMSARTSSPFAGRIAGLLCRHRRTIWSSTGGTLGTIDDGGGGTSLTCAASARATLSYGNVTRPVSASKNVTPSE